MTRNIRTPPPKRRRKPRRPLLIPNWRRAWRMLSVQAAAVAVTVGLLPPDQQAAVLAAVGIPPERLPLAVGLLFIAARLIGQPAVDAVPAADVPESRFGDIPPDTHPAQAEPVEAPRPSRQPRHPTHHHRSG